MRSVKKVLVIAPHYHTFIKGMVDAAAHFVSHINILIPHNYLSEFAPYLPFPYFRHVENFSKGKIINPKEKPENVEINVISTIYFTPDSRNQRLGDKLFKEFDEYIKNTKKEFDLIHAHFTWPCGYVGAKLSEKYDIPLIITVHENRDWFLREYNSGNDKIYWTWTHANALIRVNKVDVPYLERFNKNVYSIPNGFNQYKFFQVDEKTLHRAYPEIPVGKKTLFTFSNLIKRKGFQYLIDAIEILISSRKDFVCIIGGEGEYKDTLQKKINNLELNDYIKLIGFVPNNKINAWMNACDFFILPSLSEGNPTVMFEALGCGKPFVGTNVGGIPEIIINDKLGILVGPGDPDGLALAIQRALETEWDTEYIQEYAEQFTWDRVAERVLNVYEKAIK